MSHSFRSVRFLGLCAAERLSDVRLLLPFETNHRRMRCAKKKTFDAFSSRGGYRNGITGFRSSGEAVAHIHSVGALNDTFNRRRVGAF